MKRTLFILVALVAFATAASASTLTVVSNKTTYNVGDAITLTVSGNSQGATSYAAFGRLDYTGSGKVTSNTQTQKALVTGWVVGGLSNGAGFSESFNQVSITPGSYAGAKDPFSTVTLIAAAAGVVNVSWHTTIDGSQLDFFGLNSFNAPSGTSFTIGAIPEPTTAALLGLGLVGLALGGGRRRSS